MHEDFQQLNDPGTHTACSVNLLGPMPAASEGGLGEPPYCVCTDPVSPRFFQMALRLNSCLSQPSVEFDLASVFLIRVSPLQTQGPS